MTIKLLSLSGSPVKGSSTEILLHEAASAIRTSLEGYAEVDHYFTRLNEVDVLPCQACGMAPTPDFCFYDDGMAPLYQRLVECDCLLIGSPIYFDAVSAQTKRFIDRCNCLRPADFEHTDPDHDFIKLLKHKRPGAMVLVGTDNGWFEGARRCIAGFFKWIEVVNEGVVTYKSPDFTRYGTARDDAAAMEEARSLGKHLAQRLKGNQ
ncbi:flavodoxin family protein [bacterium]|nr:flavodoxin family protein [bacterium]